MRLGISVSRTMLRAVGVARGRVVWAAQRPRDDGDPLADALLALAAERPRGARTARVALASDCCQVKILTELRGVSPAQLRRAVALRPARWFLQNGGPLVTAGAPLAHRRLVIAAAESALLCEIGEGVAAAGLRLDGIVPATLGMAALLPGGVHARYDGTGTDVLEIARGSLVAARRSAGGTGIAHPEPDVHHVPGLADEGAAYFEAYAAAVGRVPLRLAMPGSGVERQRRTRRMLWWSLTVALVLWLAAGTLLWLRAGRAATAARASVDAIAPAVDRAVALQRDIGRADELLALVATARLARSHDAALLAVLTKVLPDSVYLLALRRAPTGAVTLVGYAPSAAQVVAWLSTTPGVKDPALQGPVTRERGGGNGRERFVVAFQWRPEARVP
ncbi:MAG TPA: PilN domain-containing protein [Gemmatimonadales bacterium]